MANTRSYPSATPKSDDLILGTSMPAANSNDDPRTVNFSVGSIGSNIITDNNIITGGGTLNTIPMFTPDGQIIGDSIITQSALGTTIAVNGIFTVDNALTVTNGGDTNVVGDLEVDSGLTVDASTLLNGALTVEGVSTFNDAIEVNNNATFYSTSTFEDTAEFQQAVRDSTGVAGTAGQVLSSTGAATLWVTSSTGSLPYTSYTALITQGSTNAPVVETVLEDDPIFGTLTFSRDLAGEYYVTSSLTPFSATTTACIINGGFNVRANFGWTVTSSSRIDFYSAEPPSTYSDNNFSRGLFEIRIYS